MKPYYEQDGITIYHGDCREVLPNVRADVAITDPPYNVGLDYCDGDRRLDYESWCVEWFSLLCGCEAIALTPGMVMTNLVMWFRIKEPDWMIGWHKPAAMGRSPFGFCNWEPVLFWGEPKRNRGTDVVRAGILPDRALDGHPCPKPEMWAVGLVTLLTDFGETVVDPFMGTGTTLVACRRLGRNAVGIEISEAYCEIAAKRLAQGALPLEMGA